MLGSGDKNCSKCIRIGDSAGDLAEKCTLATIKVVGTFASREVITESETGAEGRCKRTLPHGAVVRTDLVTIVVEGDTRSINGLARVSRSSSDGINIAGVVATLLGGCRIRTAAWRKRLVRYF